MKEGRRSHDKKFVGILWRKIQERWRWPWRWHWQQYTTRYRRKDEVASSPVATPQGNAFESNYIVSFRSFYFNRWTTLNSLRAHRQRPAARKFKIPRQPSQARQIISGQSFGTTAKDEHMITLDIQINSSYSSIISFMTTFPMMLFTIRMIIFSLPDSQQT